MRNLFKKIEGLILIVLCIYILALIVQGNYGYYLNPKFMWLTASSAAFLLILGIFNLVYSAHKPRAFALIVFIVIIMLCLFVPTTILNESDLLQAPF